MSESLLSLAEVRDRTKLSKSGIYAQMAQGTFPRPRKSGTRSLWRESDVSAWINALPEMGQKMGRTQKAA